MKQTTPREKVFLGIAALAVIAIFVYFVFWPMLQGGQSGAVSSLGEVQERLELMEKLEDMEPLLVDLKEKMKSRSGYGETSFKRGTADSAIITYLDQAANQAGIRDLLEQLDAKPDTTRRTRTEAKTDQAVLRSVVDQMYLSQVLNEMERETNSTDETAAEDDQNSSNMEQAEQDEQKDQDDFDPRQLPPVALRFLEERGISIEELEEDPELRKKLRREFEARFGRGEGSDPPDERDAANPRVAVSPRPRVSVEPDDVPEDSELDGSGEDMDRIKPIFPPIPGDIPDEVKRSLVESIEERQGQTTGIADINRALDNAGVEAGKEKERIRRRLRLYSDHVKEKKNESLRWFIRLGILQNTKANGKVDRFAVKMVFKSRMEQLVRLLYNLQDSARWLKIESMRVSISDRKQTLLSVELSMTATTLYDL